MTTALESGATRATTMLRGEGVETAISPFFEEDAGVGGEDGMALEVLVVALGEVVAEVGAAALGAGEGGLEDGVGYGAEGLGFSEAAAGIAVLREFGESGIRGGLGGETLAQRWLVAEEAGVGPHVCLKLGDEGLDFCFFGGR